MRNQAETRSNKQPTTFRRQLWLMLAPYLIGTAILTVVPALATLIVAFSSYAPNTPFTFNGVDNFANLWASPLIRLSLRNSLIFLVTAVPLRTAIALGLALLLQSERRFFAAYRTAIYLPTIIPEAAYALLWLWILNPLYGPINMILAMLRLPAPAWLTEPSTALAAMIIMSLFQVGEGFVVVLAGLQSIPRYLKDAARVDGAGSWLTFRHVTWPLLLPWLLILSFRDLIVALQNTFAPTFIMTYGGPYYATTFVPLLIYEIAFDLFDFGLAAAVLVVLYVMVGLLIYGVFGLMGGDGNG